MRVPAKRSRGIEMGYRQVLGLRTKGQGRRRGAWPRVQRPSKPRTFRECTNQGKSNSRWIPAGQGTRL